MESIIEKLQNINTFLSKTDDSKINAETEILQHLKKIDILVDKMYSKIITSELSKDVYDQFKHQNQKEKLIAKLLFPYYWTLNEQIEIKNNDELKNIFNDLNKEIGTKNNDELIND
jgi:hypothetical protein